MARYRPALAEMVMVIDTMVFAYALLKVEGFHEEALSVLSKASEIRGSGFFSSGIG